MSDDYREIFGRDPEPWREPLGALRLTLAGDDPWTLERARAECEALVKVLNETAVRVSTAATIRAQSPLPREVTDDGPWEYGRRERSSGMVRPLMGVPLPDWWGESQAEWEHVRARPREWEPVPATTEGEKHGTE